MKTKHIFVTGGVVSGLGKGITAASLGRLLKQRGLRVTIQKFDPYFNIDPGTMSPFQHGEVFVTDDGAETDLDLGHYERFVDENLTENSSVSSGKIYWEVLNRERAGDYLGKTVQIIPHITNEIKSRIYSLVNDQVDVVITEIGGTVGDIESQPYMEAIRQVAHEVGRENVLFVHVSLIVEIPGSREQKSKPTQHSVKEMLGMGIQPDIIVCRCNSPLEPDIIDKISLFCNVEREAVIENRTANSLYEVPLLMHNEGLDTVACKKLNLITPEADLTEWTNMVQRNYAASDEVVIALVGKYNALQDSYLSVVESLNHAGIENDVKVRIEWIDAERVNDDNAEIMLEDYHGILVPGGFGDRGIEGMIAAVRYARESKVPYFGICLGMQMAVIEFARHQANLEEAHSTEFNQMCKHPVIDLMLGQRGIREKGGTMRLGKYPCTLKKGSKSAKAYGSLKISERHRHRYEFNNAYRDTLTEKGLLLVGQSPDENIVEIVEIADHPWFVAAQFHPEFKSRPNRAHPLFRDFIAAAKILSKE